jgi:hypothetical protein
MKSVHSLDTLHRDFYKSPARAALAALLLWAVPSWGELVMGAQIPDGARKVGELRYRSPKGYEETLQHYRAVYPPGQYPRKPIVNQPGVRAVHISVPSGKQFDGLNIYEANDEVRIYVVPANEVEKPGRKRASPKSAKPAKLKR